jgi:hypothetical protein
MAGRRPITTTYRARRLGAGALLLLAAVLLGLWLHTMTRQAGGTTVALPLGQSRRVVVNIWQGQQMERFTHDSSWPSLRAHDQVEADPGRMTLALSFQRHQSMAPLSLTAVKLPTWPLMLLAALFGLFGAALWPRARPARGHGHGGNSTQ